jgi:hypothetical protein
MIGRICSVAEQARVVLFLVALLTSLLSLSACGDFRKAIGLDRTGPDEFAVESRAPLTIPPEFELRPPAPGTARPQEATSADRARKVIDTAGPGEPGKQAGPGLKTAGGLRGAEVDQSQQVGDQSLAQKLLGASDTGATGEKRETTPLKGVY